jgi:hypothetical protein
MKTNQNERPGLHDTDVDLEALVTRGRKLHDQAVLEICAGMFKRITFKSRVKDQGAMRKAASAFNPASIALRNHS